MKEVKTKTGGAPDFPQRSAEIEKEIADWRARLAVQQEELAGIDREQKTQGDEMDEYLLAAAKGDIEAEKKLASLEMDIAVGEAHRKRIAATVAKIEGEIVRLESERQSVLKQEAAWRIQNRMPEVKRLTDTFWQAYHVSDSAVADLWEITRQDQVDGALIGLDHLGTSKKFLHARHLPDFLERLKSHADNNREVGGEQFKDDLPTTLAASQAELQRDIDNALGRTESKTTRAA